MLQSQINPQLAGHGGRVSLWKSPKTVTPFCNLAVAVTVVYGRCDAERRDREAAAERIPELKGVRDLTEHQRGEHSYY